MKRRTRTVPDSGMPGCLQVPQSSQHSLSDHQQHCTETQTHNLSLLYMAQDEVQQIHVKYSSEQFIFAYAQ